LFWLQQKFVLLTCGSEISRLSCSPSLALVTGGMMCQELRAPECEFSTVETVQKDKPIGNAGNSVATIIYSKSSR
jgi:hypothetical protein